MLSSPQMRNVFIREPAAIAQPRAGHVLNQQAQLASRMQMNAQADALAIRTREPYAGAQHRPSVSSDDDRREI